MCVQVTKNIHKNAHPWLHFLTSKYVNLKNIYKIYTQIPDTKIWNRKFIYMLLYIQLGLDFSVLKGQYMRGYRVYLWWLGGTPNPLG